MMNTCRCGPLTSNFRGWMAGRASLTGLAGLALVLLPFLLDMMAQLRFGCWMLSEPDEGRVVTSGGVQ